MGVISAAAKALIAAGVTGDALVAALERIEAAQPVAAVAIDAQAERRRAKDRERAIVRRRLRKSAESADLPDRERAIVRRRLRKSADLPPDEPAIVRRRLRKSAESADLPAIVRRRLRKSADLPPDKEIPPTPPKEINPSPSLRSEKPSNARVRAVRIPEKFAPDVLVAEELGLSREDASAEAANFLDYWRAKPSNAAKLDWSATWRIWCRKAVADRARSTGPPSRRKEPGMGALWADFERKRNARTYETPAGSGDAGMDGWAEPSGNGHGAEWGRTAAEPSPGRGGPIIDIEVEPKLS